MILDQILKNHNFEGEILENLSHCSPILSTNNQIQSISKKFERVCEIN